MNEDDLKSDKEESSSENGEMPEYDLSSSDLIISLITTFEANNRHSKTVINYRYDPVYDFVTLDIECAYNGRNFEIPVFGFDREKIISMSKNILKYFENKSGQNDK